MLAALITDVAVCSNMSAGSSRSLFNLARTNVLLADADTAGQSILGQMLAGFGARNIVRVEDVAELKRQLAAGAFDLMLFDPAGFGPDGYAVVSWLRRNVPPPKAHIPVLVVTGHTQHARVGELRDCGTNFVVSKPLSASVLLERLLWLARENRPYVETDSYAGPDRRWHDTPLPDKVEGRRRKDRELAARIAAGGDMNQDEIDRVMTAPIAAAPSP